jgi:hypothetical protein
MFYSCASLYGLQHLIKSTVNSIGIRPCLWTLMILQTRLSLLCNFVGQEMMEINTRVPMPGMIRIEPRSNGVALLGIRTNASSSGNTSSSVD